MTAKLKSTARVLALAAAFLTGCAALPERPASPGEGESLLRAGVAAYEDGDLKTADQRLTAALRAGLADKDRVTAYKYLAFINCSTGREQQCREDFVAALAIDPGLQLSPAEAGHPVWGPIFKNVKAQRAR